MVVNSRSAVPDSLVTPTQVHRYASAIAPPAGVERRLRKLYTTMHAQEDNGAQDALGVYVRRGGIDGWVAVCSDGHTAISSGAR